jgi:hypothetical protein
MPSTSKKQEHFMQAVAHSPSFAKKADVPQSVGKDFAEADTRKHLAKSLRKRPSGAASSTTQGTGIAGAGGNSGAGAG